MRGTTKLSKIFNSSDSELQNSRVKGRSADLLNDRNTALLHRFYFYSTFTELKFERIISNVSRDFYLTPRRVTDILSKEVEMLTNIRKEKPSISKLRSKFIQFNWTLSTYLAA